VRPRIVLYYNDLVFTPSESFLFKDFGQVPFVLSELYGADLEYWIAAMQPNPGLTSFRGRPVRQFGKSLPALPARLDRLNNAPLFRAMRRERAMTHLVMFPFTPFTDAAVARLARRVRPDVKIILKLDANIDYLTRIARDWQRYRSHPARRLRQSHHYRALLDIADVILCETDACHQLLGAGFLGLDLGDRLVQTYSGLSSRWLASLGVEAVPFERRRRSIVVSGRISSAQKDTALVLAAGPPPPGWTIDFVGEVDAALAQTIARHRAADPDFDRHYRFHGAVMDKRAYFDILMNARALLMNSRGGEGFPNVFAEAHACGLFIVTSDVSGAAEATGGGRWGIVYPPGNAAALRSALAALPARVEAAGGDPAPPALRDRFVWEHSLDQPAIRRLFHRPSPATAA
jgi:glycosyltransferase involved in cell wall biosynthesis